MKETNEKKPSILIVDDESVIRNLLAEMLAGEYYCVTSESAEAALVQFETQDFDLVISDINLGGMSGVEMVPRIQSLSPDTVVMMISGANSVDTAIDAMRVGVFDYLPKPFDFDQVIVAVRRALTHHQTLVAKRVHEVELARLVEQKTAELQHIAHHDRLTDLPNETMFGNRLSELLAGYDVSGRAAVLLVSVSNLRAVRDSIGKAAADQILFEVARRLQALGKDGMVARFEGDKFALAIADADSNRVVEANRQIFAAIEPEIIVDHHEIHTQVSIGIGLFPTDGTEYQTLVQNAGAALSQAEAIGTGSFRFYAPEMNARAVEQLTLESNLRAALSRDELSVYYQPKVDIQSGRITGMEALLRWKNSELGPVTPNVFIPIAESTGLIIPIGEWVLRTACFQTRKWHDEGYPLHVAVNLSACQFEDKNLSTNIWKILQETGIDPHYLNLEITESSVVTNPEVAIAVLTQLQELGISISIDDFGTGHSSLGYLRTLPVDVLKVDKSFVDNITNDTDAATLVNTMITLGHDLRLRVVAEGVETDGQLQLLRSMGCDEWQGFLHSKPMPPGEFELRLNAESKPAAAAYSNIIC